jgi:hypothetical protein
VLSNSFIRNIITLSNTLGCNITTLSNSLSCNITRLSNTLSCNITILSNTLSCNITTLSNSLRTNITNVSNFFTAKIITPYLQYTVSQADKTGVNQALGLLRSNIFSNNPLVFPGTYLINIKFILYSPLSGSFSNALPYIYIAQNCNTIEAQLEDNKWGYLNSKAIYPINTSFRFHTLTDIIITNNNFNPTVFPYNLYYSEQSSSASYSAKIDFAYPTIQRIA